MSNSVFPASKHVPLRSVWLLQLYASRTYQSGDVADSAVEQPGAELPVLLATMLCQQVEDRLRRELSVGFSRRSQVIHRVRGKIDLYHTLRHQLLDKGQVKCEFNELSSDNAINRYLLRALFHGEKLVSACGEMAVATRCRRLARTLQNAGVAFDAASPRPRTRLTAADRRPVDAATLLLDFLIPSTGAEARGFRRAALSEEKLRVLFEQALLGLYRVHLVGWKPTGSQKLEWCLENGSQAKVPQMETDILLHSPQGAPIIVDAKFTSMAARNRDYALKLKSGHIYQIFAYVMAYAAANPGTQVMGVMVYGTLGATEAEDFPREQRFGMHGHQFVFKALDLTATPAEIRQSAIAAVTGTHAF